MQFRKLFSTSGLIVAGALLLIINLLAGLTFKSSRIDLTENQLYTLSQGTKNILENIEEPINLRFYFSEKLLVSIPGVMSYGRRVKELLAEYQELSDGGITLTVTDPEPFSDEEDNAVQYGLQGVPINTAGSLAYFGLVGINDTDDEEVIAFFQPDKEESLEYDITKLVNKLSNQKKQTVGLISSLPIEGGSAANPFMPPPQQANQEWVILSQLKQLFDVRKLDADAEKIPDDINVLMLVHPKNLTDKALFAIDQFVLNGGHTIAFVDPYSEADTPVTDPQNPMSAMTASRHSDLTKLFDAWGIELISGKLAADRLSATRVNANAGGRPQAMDYVVWLSLTENNFNTDDFVTGELKTISMGTPGMLRKKEGAETNFTPLIETSEQGMEVPTSRVQFGPNPAALLREYRPGGEKLVLAARIAGTVKTAFPDGAPEGVSNDDVLSESKEAVNLIVVADTDMLSDQFWVNKQNFFGQNILMPRANNDTFLINAIDNLSGSNDLISLRSRGKSSRPFDKVIELKREAEQKFREKEKTLQEKLREAEQKLSELQRQKEGGSNMILSSEQKREIEKFRSQQVQTRKELRNVQHELGKNIENLGSTLKVINIGLIPFLIIIISTGLGIYRMRKLSATAAV